MPENTNNHIKDSDHKLAKAYGETLEGKKEESSISDPLFRLLQLAREKDQSMVEGIPVEGRESDWERVEQEISGSNKTKNRFKIYSLSTGAGRLLAAAAVLIIVAFSALLFLQQPGMMEPQLVAESGNIISTVELKDGSRVTLRPNSKLYEISGNTLEHRYELAGEALFEVVPSDDRTFSVEAGKGRVIVMGTTFNVHERDQAAAVHLIDGQVRFETIDRSHFVELLPGEAATIDQQNVLSDPFLFNEREITSWTENRLIFRDRQASSIFAELEFHFNITIEAPDHIKNEYLGGSIAIETPEESLQDLGNVLGGHFDKLDENTYKFRMSE